MSRNGSTWSGSFAAWPSTTPQWWTFTFPWLSTRSCWMRRRRWRTWRSCPPPRPGHLNCSYLLKWDPNHRLFWPPKLSLFYVKGNVPICSDAQMHLPHQVALSYISGPRAEAAGGGGRWEWILDYQDRKRLHFLSGWLRPAEHFKISLPKAARGCTSSAAVAHGNACNNI